MIDLNEMTVFVKVVEAGTITGGAQALGLPKSTVSRRLQQLESRLGVRLLQRTTRSMTLTEQGAVYYERCARIIDEAEEADLAVVHEQIEPTGLLRVTAPIDTGVTRIGRLAAEFMERYPKVRIDLDLSNRFVDLVQEGFDVAVRAGRLQDSSLIAKRIGNDRLGVFASPAFVARHGRPESPEDLETHPAIVYGTTRATPTYRFEKAGRAVIVNPRPVLSVNNISAARDAAAGGAGIVFLPAHTCREDVETGHLEALLEDWQTPETGIYAVYPSPRHLTPKVRAFIDFLAERFAE